MVYEIEKCYPGKKVGLNGDITNLSEIIKYVKIIDHRMIARQEYRNHIFFSKVKSCFLYN